MGWHGSGQPGQAYVSLGVLVAIEETIAMPSYMGVLASSRKKGYVDVLRAKGMQELRFPSQVRATQRVMNQSRHPCHTTPWASVERVQLRWTPWIKGDSPAIQHRGRRKRLANSVSISGVRARTRDIPEPNEPDDHLSVLETDIERVRIHRTVRE